jgi:hypothetical protein
MRAYIKFNLAAHANGTDAQFTEDGNKLLTICGNDAHLKIWDINDDIWHPKIRKIEDDRLKKFRTDQ